MHNFSKSLDFDWELLYNKSVLNFKRFFCGLAHHISQGEFKVLAKKIGEIFI